MFIESVIIPIVAGVFFFSLAFLTACEDVDPSDLLSISLGQLRVAREQLSVQQRQLEVQSEQIALQRQIILAMQSSQPLWLSVFEGCVIPLILLVLGWFLRRQLARLGTRCTRRRLIRQVAQIPGKPQAVPALNRSREVPLAELVEMDNLRGFARMKNYFSCSSGSASMTPQERHRFSGGADV